MVRCLASFVLAAELLIVSGTAGLAENETVETFARLTSRFQLIIETCTADKGLDRERARDYQSAFGEIGRNVYGEKAFAAAEVLAFKQRRQEVADTGVVKWCAAQRAWVIATGAPDVFR